MFTTKNFQQLSKIYNTQLLVFVTAYKLLVLHLERDRKCFYDNIYSTLLQICSSPGEVIDDDAIMYVLFHESWYLNCHCQLLYKTYATSTKFLLKCAGVETLFHITTMTLGTIIH